MARQGIPPLASYYDKPATATQLRFTGWLIEQVGLNLHQMTPEQAFEKGVALSTVLRSSFQQSDENQDHLARRRKERRAEMQARARRREEPSSAREPSDTSEPDSGREPSTSSDTPRSRRRGGSRASKAAAKTAEDRPTVTGPAGSDEDATVPPVAQSDDPFADDFEGEEPEEDKGPAPVGSAWLGGASAARAGKPADGGRGVLKPAPW
jgi:hypothetical protein